MSEIVLILFVALMLFGSKNIPEIARTLGKGMAQIKNATNEIKSEIQKSSEYQELNELKEGFSKDLNSLTGNLTKDFRDIEDSVSGDINKQIAQVKEDIESLEGPIKRQR